MPRSKSTHCWLWQLLAGDNFSGGNGGLTLSRCTHVATEVGLFEPARHAGVRCATKPVLVARPVAIAPGNLLAECPACFAPFRLTIPQWISVVAMVNVGPWRMRESVAGGCGAARHSIVLREWNLQLQCCLKPWPRRARPASVNRN